MNQFTNVHYAGRNQHFTAEAIYQYDRGRQMRIYGLNENATLQVQYSILGMQKTLTDMPTYTDTIWISNIPNVLLAQTSEIQAYLYISTATQGQTIVHVTIPVTPRTKPDGYQYTEAELKGLEYVLEQLNNALRNAETATTNASAAANAANNIVTAVKPFSNVSATVTPVEHDAKPTVQLTQTGSSTNFAFAIPQGVQGKDGNPGVYVGADQPTDPNVQVWINTNDEVKSFEEAVAEHLRSQYVHTIQCVNIDGTTSTFQVYGVIQ